MADALNKLAEIQGGIMLTVHGYTGDQMLLDGPQRKGNLRRSRVPVQLTSYHHLQVLPKSYRFSYPRIKW